MQPPRSQGRRRRRSDPPRRPPTPQQPPTPQPGQSAFDQHGSQPPYGQQPYDQQQQPYGQQPHAQQQQPPQPRRPQQQPPGRPQQPQYEQPQYEQQQPQYEQQQPQYERPQPYDRQQPPRERPPFGQDDGGQDDHDSFWPEERRGRRSARRDSYSGAGHMGKDLDIAFVGANRSRQLFRILVILVVGVILLAGLGALGYLFFGSPGQNTGSAVPRNDPSPTGGQAAHADQPPAVPPVVTPNRAPYIPQRGTGKFIRPPVTSAKVAGRGTVLRYMVEVEGGIRQQPQTFARTVDTILADPRGWTAGGRWAFKRVNSGPFDFVVRLAAPGTVDKLCAVYGLETKGQTNCSGGKQVVVNLRRWLLLTTYYRGQPDHYHALTINHEVGHRLGYNHMTCARKGALAPVMQQQIFGLKGCKINGWPYDRRGRFITGPAVQ